MKVIARVFIGISMCAFLFAACENGTGTTVTFAEDFKIVGHYTYDGDVASFIKDDSASDVGVTFVGDPNAVTTVYPVPGPFVKTEFNLV